MLLLCAILNKQGMMAVLVGSVCLPATSFAVPALFKTRCFRQLWSAFCGSSCGMWHRAATVREAVLSSFAGTSHVDAEFADICDAVSATQRIKHKTRLLFNKKHAPQLVRRPL